MSSVRKPIPTIRAPSEVTSLAHRFAMENDLIRADCIESTEFPDLANRYRVFAVPKTVINQESYIEGALPERAFLETILQTIEPQADAESSTAPG